MRILTLTSSYPKFAGDATAPFIESLTANIARLGHEVHLVVPEHREWSRPHVEDGVHYHPFRYSPSRRWTPWGYSVALQGGHRIRRPLYALAPIVYLSAVRKCIELLSSMDFDVIHAHWVVPNGLIAASVSRRTTLPLVISLHGSDVAVAERSRWIGPRARRSLAMASAVTVASCHTLDRARSLGVPRDALELAPYGVDLDRFRPDETAAVVTRERLGLRDSDVMVLAIGRLVAVKGFEYAIDAMARVRNDAPNAHLVIAGDGDLRQELESRARERGLQRIVTFVGEVPRGEVPSYFAAADIVVVPSIHHRAGFVEALGNVGLEAMAASRPVIASRVGGLPEIIKDGETGVLVDERDADALAKEILRLARDPADRSTLGAKGRRRAEQSLTWAAAAQRLVEIYERVVDQR